MLVGNQDQAQTYDFRADYAASGQVYGSATRTDQQTRETVEYEKCLAHEECVGHFYLENLDPVRDLLMLADGAVYALLGPGVAITCSVDAQTTIAFELREPKP